MMAATRKSAVKQPTHYCCTLLHVIKASKELQAVVVAAAAVDYQKESSSTLSKPEGTLCKFLSASCALYTTKGSGILCDVNITCSLISTVNRILIP